MTSAALFWIALFALLGYLFDRKSKSVPMVELRRRSARAKAKREVPFWSTFWSAFRDARRRRRPS